MELVGDWGISLLKYVSVVLLTQVKKGESLFVVLLGWQRFLCNIATRPLISRWDLCHYKSRALVVKEILPKYEGVSGNFHSILRGENYQSKHKGFVHAVYLWKHESSQELAFINAAALVDNVLRHCRSVLCYLPFVELIPWLGKCQRSVAKKQSKTTPPNQTKKPHPQKTWEGAGVWVFTFLLTSGLIYSSCTTCTAEFVFWFACWGYEVRFELESFIFMKLIGFVFLKKLSVGKGRQSCFTTKAIHRKRRGWWMHRLTNTMSKTCFPQLLGLTRSNWGICLRFRVKV